MCLESRKIPNGTDFGTTILYLRITRTSRQNPVPSHGRKPPRTKRLNRFRNDDERLLQALNSTSKTLKQKNGARVIRPRPALKVVRILTSITAIASGIIRYGPSYILRAAHDLINEASILIFGDDLDAWTTAAHIADRKRSAVR